MSKKKSPPSEPKPPKATPANPVDAAITRRTFLGTTSAAMGVLALGCGEDAPERRGTPTPLLDQRIVAAKIHPAIGVARIGNSTAEDGFFFAPEVLAPPLTAVGGSRDGRGALKRQVARFRIYGYNAAGQVVRELTSAEAAIEWRVHVANKKAAWYRFLAALDLPEAEGLRSLRRNPTVLGAERNSLVIDPGARTLSGPALRGPAFSFDGGFFRGTPVSLGEARTDADGRLLVFPAAGRAESPTGQPIFHDAPDAFANADGWFDDVADGPVSAVVTFEGRVLDMENGQAWVFVAPPNYAPDVIAWRTLYDLLVEVYTDPAVNMMTFPATTSFQRDILPIFQRMSGLQWVNKGFADRFGRGTEFDFENVQQLARLAHRPENPGDPDPHFALRQSLLARFRAPDTTSVDREKWPYIYGDAFGSFPGSPQNNLTLSRLRATHLARWADGNFINDFDPKPVRPASLAEVDVADQPALLDQAALHFCLADAFHPGCEVTWPVRHGSMYSAPFRIKHRPVDQPERDHGPVLLRADALGPNGSLHAQSPGDLTRWMALPWQADTAFCRSGYEPEFHPHIPTFWPARVPNHVLSEADYRIAVNRKLSDEARRSAFANRPSWFRSLTGDAKAQMRQMVDDFPLMGMIEMRPGLENDPIVPPVVFVETIPAQRIVLEAFQPRAAAFALPRPRTRVEEAGWENEAQLREFRRIRGVDRK